MTRLAYTWVDVFAPRPFAGNQLAVFRVPPDLPLSTMQRLARELNHSETVFLQPPTAAGADVRVRILLPTAPLAEEIPFAGHPVLGAACVAAMDGAYPATLRLETGVGVVPVTVTAAGEGRWEAVMQQPVPRVVRALACRTELAAALGLGSDAIDSTLPVEAVDNGMQTVIIPLRSLEAVRMARPDMQALRTLLGREGLCTMVFALGGVEFESHVHCRVFGPFDMVPEDPATGSANGPLGEYLVRHSLAQGDSIISEQGYEIGRPSRLTIRVEREAGITRTLFVGGSVVLVGEGAFRVES